MNCRKSTLAIVVLACLAVLPPLAGAKRRTTRVDYTAIARERGMGNRLAATVLMNGSFPEQWLRRAGGDRPLRSLDWPLPDHRLGRGFGSDDGRHLAVDITADVGTPVRTLGPGVVGYADDTVQGYGKMLLVLHPGGWVSLYAHLDAFQVRPGQRLRRGQVIARSGNTGISRGPHLHFALFIGGQAVDPLDFIRDVPGRKPRLS